MSSFLQTLGLLCLAISAFGQQVIQGHALSAEGQPLAYPNVLLLNVKDSSLVTGAVVNEYGLYTLEGLIPGHYLLAARMVGYHTRYSNTFSLTSATGTYRMPALVATPDQIQLGEVTVRASKPLFEQQIDKLVVNPSAMITAAGGTLLELLERSPGVRIDRQNGGITMSGKQGVMVMINGKLARLPVETLLQMLGSMNVENVEKIELISNPPANYDAEGNAGLINIVLKRRQDEGTNGGFRLWPDMAGKKKRVAVST